MTQTTRLWQAVLAAALHDAAKGKDQGWIGSADFHVVCALADLDGDAVLSAFEADSDSPRRAKAA